MAEQEKIDISKLNKAEVLVALYGRAKPQGMGFLQYTPEDMTKEEAQEILDDGQTYFDYVRGRVMKVDPKGDTFDPRSYDCHNGPGAAAGALENLKEVAND